MRRGFSLLEVLVALTVIAIALVALVKLSGVSAQASGALAARIEARWVAQNHLALARARRAWPDQGSRAGEATMNRRRFSWQEVVSETPNPNFRKLEIEVTDLAREVPAVKLSTLLVRPGL